MKKRYQWLAHVINKNSYRIGAEIGAATGNTTGYLMDNCPNLEKLIVVDMWYPIPNSGQWDRKDMEKVFRNKFENNTRIEIIKSMSWEGAKHVNDKTLDFVFIDASHEYEDVIRDFRAWFPKVRKGGTFCGHDYHFEGVQKALNEMFKFELTGIDNCWYVNDTRR